MHPALKDLLITMINRRFIGGKHFPEDKLLHNKIKWIENDDRHQFEVEYNQLVNQGIIIRQKKRTGKGSSWHIWLNPSIVYDLKRQLFGDVR